MISFILLLFLFHFFGLVWWLDINVEALRDDLGELLRLGSHLVQDTRINLARRRYL